MYAMRGMRPSNKRTNRINSTVTQKSDAPFSARQLGVYIYEYDYNELYAVKHLNTIRNICIYTLYRV